MTPTPLSKPLAVGNTVRIAPGRNRVPLCAFWKFWVTGNEVYATTRGGDPMHLSVHASGQIHMRIGGKDLQHLAPPLWLGQGQSLHAFEVKFLVGPDALLPKPRPDRRKAFLIETPEGFSLVLNLVLGMPGTDGAVPPEFLPAGETIWRARLPDSRPVTLVGRVLQMSAEDQGELEYIRRELNPKITFSGKPSNPYIETRHVHWSPTGGNVIVVIPLGPEGFRVDPSPITADHAAGAEKRILHLSSSNARIPVIAPDRAIVAHMEVKGVESSLELVKEQPKRAQGSRAVLAWHRALHEAPRLLDR